MSRMKFLNTEIDNLTFKEAVQKADELVQNDTFDYVVTPNVDHIVQLESNEKLQDVYKHASMVLTDGKPLLWIANMKKTPIKEKISGSDFFPALMQVAAVKQYRVFLLGAGEGVAEIAKKNLEGKFPGLHISGAYSPPFGFEKDKQELENITKIINEANTDILAVGLGAPKQELFLYNVWKSGDIKAKLGLGIGATIDFEAGNVKRAPKWISDHGLEWAYRITQDPGRLVKRYWKDFTKIGPIMKKYK